MIEWRFKPNAKDDQSVDPIQTEFFTTSIINNVSTALIREGIQNALDEGNKGGITVPVKVRIFLSGEKYAVKSNDYKSRLNTLIPHLEAKSSGIQKLPDFNADMPFIVFEDFNTNGLEGDPEEFKVENLQDKKPHNFFYFWRNVGRSGKSDDQLGRWGLGKTVFPSSSKINTFWGLTVRKSDNRKLLMGQSILRIHNREDHEKKECGYQPYGRYGEFKDSSTFNYPIENEHEIKLFEELFRLERNQNPGLSIIIPFYYEEITIDHLAYAVIEQYFYPILGRKLIVEIVYEDEKVFLGEETIEKELDKIDFNKLNSSDEKKRRNKESLSHLFEFTRWTLQLDKNDSFHLKPPDLNLQPRWSKDLFSDDENLNKVRDKFENEERIAFKIPIKYHPENGVPKICWYDAYLEKDKTLLKPDNLFVRDGITISGITSLDKGLVRGLVVIHDSDLARLLGDSENPAHTEWQSDSRNFKDKYIHGKESLVFVKNTLKKIYENLQRPSEGLQKDLLIDFFSIPIETKEDKKIKEIPQGTSGEKDNIHPELPTIPANRQPLLIEKINSGLRITNNKMYLEPSDNICIKLGYDVPQGNPIKNYQELDFDISKAPIKLESHGVHITKMKNNILEFEIDDSNDFEIKLTGFDEKRDLFLKIQK